MKRLESLLLGFAIAISADPANSQRVKLEMSKNRICEADYYLQGDTLLSSLIKVKFSERVFDLPRGSIIAYLTDLPETLRSLRDRLQSIEERWGSFQIRKMIPNAKWGDTLVEQPSAGKWVLVPDLSQWYEFRFDNLIPIDRVMGELESLPEVFYAEPPAIAVFYESPNDPYYLQGQWGLTQIQASSAWEVSKGSQTISLGMVECGVNLNHPDLVGKVIGGDGRPLIMTDHGTGISGIAAANTDNGVGVASLGWNLKLRTYSYEFSTFAACIDAAADSNTAINMSFGIFRPATPSDMPYGCQGQAAFAVVPKNDASVRQAIERASGLDRVLVAAYGNVSPNDQAIQDGRLDEECDPCAIPFLSYPARYSNVIGVSATWLNNGDEQFYDGYNYGEMVDLGAPGVSIDVLSWNGYMNASGTSCSAPLVTALTGLIRSLNPSLSATQVADILYATTDKIDTRPGHEYYGTPSWNEYLGYGRINAYKALLKVVEDLANQNNSTLVSATLGNNQRKLYRESSAKLHEVFESGGEVFYRNSTNDGSSWPVTLRITSGTAGASAPCIAMAGSTVLVAWQRETAPGTFDIVLSRSTDGGNQWFGPTTLRTGILCSTPKPNPTISGYSGGYVFLAYRNQYGNKIEGKRSYDYGATWGATPDVPESNGNSNMPTSAIYYAYWGTRQANVAYATDLPTASPAIKYSYYDFGGGTWGNVFNLSSILPVQYSHHANPNIAQSSQDPTYKVLHVVWDAEDTWMGDGTRVIVHRKGGFRSFGSTYSILHYETEDNPSISGLAQERAWMVYQIPEGQGSGFWKRYYDGTNWAGGTFMGSGFNPQLSVGSSSAKYLYTLGSSSPYQVALGSETLNKTGEAVDYARLLSFKDSKTSANLCVEIAPAALKTAVGDWQPISFSAAPQDTVPLTFSEILAAGGSSEFALPADVDSIRIPIRVWGEGAAELFASTEGQVSVRLEAAETAALISKVIAAPASSLANEPVQERELVFPMKDLSPSLKGQMVRLMPEIQFLRDDENVTPSLGHIYGTHFGGSLKRIAAELGSGRQQRSGPDEFLLLSSYPNPFNPSTTLRYQLPVGGRVSLIVYDVLGREIDRLVEETKEAGDYSVTWNAMSRSSGVYYVRFTVVGEQGAQLHSSTTKVLLVK